MVNSCNYPRIILKINRKGHTPYITSIIVATQQCLEEDIDKCDWICKNQPKCHNKQTHPCTILQGHTPILPTLFHYDIIRLAKYGLVKFQRLSCTHTKIFSLLP